MPDKVDTPAPTPAEPATPPEPAPIYYDAFAKDTAWRIGLLGAIVGVVFLLAVLLLVARGWETLEGRLKVGMTIAVPVAVLGIVIVLAGLWMAVVEWRGRFAEKPAPKTRDFGVEPDKIIEAVGKLRGAALAMVVGAILIVASAWIAQAAAGTASNPAPSPAASQAAGSQAP